jgi:chromosome segregation ATPase
LTKSTALRQKLESLCRELQRQNKMFLDDSKRVAAEEEKKRLELSVKFHETVKDISAKLEEQGEDRLRQLEENELMREKLNHFTQQFDIREQQFAHQLRTKTLEHQLLEVKLKQQQDISMQAETKSRLYTEQIAQLLKTEQDLRSQLALYGDKFEQFQDTLTKSNEVFATFKIELEKMSKTVKKLEKENASLKKKCEKSDVSIIELLEERDVLKKLLSTTKNQKEKLEALCRSLQAERKLQSVTFDSANSSLPSQLENLKLSNPE